MWKILKFDHKNLELLKKDLFKKLGQDLKIYIPKLRIQKYKNNKLINKEINLLGSYMFCFHESFGYENKINSLRFLRGLKYFLEGFTKSQSDIEEFIKKCMPLVRESLRFLDIIFFTPITKVAPVELEEDDLRDTNKEYIEEIDNIFKAVHRDYSNNPKSTFFVEEDRPAIIEVFGNRRERIELINLYLDNDGDFIEPGDIITPEEMQEMEKMKKAFRIE